MEEIPRNMVIRPKNGVFFKNYFLEITKIN